MGLMSYIRNPMVVKTPEGLPYLKRWFILRTKWVQVYVHNICRSDPDSDMHDHPWSFISVILWGGYLEHTPEGSFQRSAPQILYRPAGSPHRLELNRGAWTFIVVGRERREWGFVTPRGWEHHKLHRGPISEPSEPAKAQ